MKILPYSVFCLLMLGALWSSLNSYHRTRNLITEDVNQALEQAMAQMPHDVVTTDTIHCYRNHLTIAQLKDTAGISMRTVRRDNQLETELVAEANCDFTTTFQMSDQRASGSLLLMGILWLMGSMWYQRRSRTEVTVSGLCYGGIVFHNDRFTTVSGEIIHLTPMQYELLEMFFSEDSHTLSKQDICNRLWPNKPDASDTLYTLIRRIKPIIEEHSNLKIESNRGRSYTLELK